MKLRGRAHTKLVIKRDPMISVGFKRVRKKRPCRICGKPSYCGFSEERTTSICMRISAGSRRLSRNGGNIHVHSGIPFMTIRPTIKRPISPISSVGSSGNQRRRFPGIDQDLSGFKIHGGTRHRSKRVAVTRTT